MAEKYQYFYACEAYVSHIISKRRVVLWLHKRNVYDPRKGLELRLDRTPSLSKKIDKICVDDFILEQDDGGKLGWTTLGGRWPGSVRNKGDAHAAEAGIYLEENVWKAAVEDGLLTIKDQDGEGAQWPPMEGTEAYQWQALLVWSEDKGTMTVKRFHGYKAALIAKGANKWTFAVWLPHKKGEEVAIRIPPGSWHKDKSHAFETSDGPGPLFLGEKAIAANKAELAGPKLPISEGGVPRSFMFRRQSRTRADAAEEIANLPDPWLETNRTVNLSHPDPDDKVLGEIQDVLRPRLLLAEDRWQVEAILQGLTRRKSSGKKQILDLIAHTTADDQLLAFGPWIIEPGQELDALCEQLEPYATALRERFELCRLIGCGSAESSAGNVAMMQLQEVLGFQVRGVPGSITADDFKRGGAHIGFPTGDGFEPSAALWQSGGFTWEELADRPSEDREPQWWPQYHIKVEALSSKVLQSLIDHAGKEYRVQPGLLTRPLLRLSIEHADIARDIDILFNYEQLRVTMKEPFERRSYRIRDPIAFRAHLQREQNLPVPRTPLPRSTR